MGIVSQKLRDSARGQLCMFQIPGMCNHDRETTVLCHIRDETKGMGNKALDISAAFGCSACHDALDQHWLPTADALFYSLRAMQRTHHNWVERGLVVIAGDTEKTRKPSHKIVPRRPLVYLPREGD